MFSSIGARLTCLADSSQFHGQLALLCEIIINPG
jgi:hypothetical protein